MQKYLTPKKTRDDYESILNAMGDVFVETDLAGNFTSINETGCRLWGLSRDEIIGTNFQAYLDAESAAFLKQAYHRIYVTGTPGRFIHELAFKDKTRRMVEVSAFPMRDDQETIIGFRAFERDVTDREEARRKLADCQRRLEAILRHVKDAVIIVDLNLRVMDANKSAESICGIRPAQVAGKIFSECPASCHRGCCEVLRQTLEQKNTIYDFRIACGQTDRQGQFVSINSAPLLDEQGKFMGAMLVIRDMTRLRDLERDLRQRYSFHNIIGLSKKIQDIVDLLEDLACLNTPVLVTGESGTGKELLAKALHYSSLRAFRPLIKVNCRALSEELLESELFGYAKNALAGACHEKAGRFELAQGGTLLLDEVGEISPRIQLKLMRVLEEKTFERMGDATVREADVRVIACSSAALSEKVRRGEFREDLYHRLAGAKVCLPPLRERAEDIVLLANHFLSLRNESQKKIIESLSREVLECFQSYAWPGNIRELEHVLEYACIVCRGKMILPEHLPSVIRNDFKVERSGVYVRHPVRKSTSQEDILVALGKTDGNKAKAARLLGINRRTVYRKMNKIQTVSS